MMERGLKTYNSKDILDKFARSIGFDRAVLYEYHQSRYYRFAYCRFVADDNLANSLESQIDVMEHCGCHIGIETRISIDIDETASPKIDIADVFMDKLIFLSSFDGFPGFAVTAQSNIVCSYGYGEQIFWRKDETFEEAMLRIDMNWMPSTATSRNC